MGLKDSDQHMVVKATTDTTIKSVTVAGKEFEFGRKAGAFTVNDPGIAHEMEARFGPKGTERPGLLVTVPNRTAGRDKLHKTVFSVPAMPWKKENENGQAESSG